MRDIVRAYIEEYHMLNPDDMVIVGVSGGADSVCLLRILRELQDEIGFDLHAVHVHHGIRGSYADRDAEFVWKLCKKLDVSCQIFYEHVPEYARIHKISDEEAGREVRKQIFARVKGGIWANKIALAHHQNDNAETVILNLARGTGLKGLGGISPVEGDVIRPLLCVNKQEIEDHLKSRRENYVIDETNYLDVATRNRVRHHVIPFLENEVNSGTVRHILETTNQMRKLAEFVEREVRKACDRCISFEDDRWIVNRRAWVEIDEALRPYVLFEVLSRAAGRKKDLESVHIRLLGDLMKRQVGRKLQLPYHVVAVRTYEGIELFVPKEGRIMEELTLKEAEDRGLICVRILENGPDLPPFPKQSCTKRFDYDIVKNTVMIRHRKPGDYLTINLDGGTQRLKQYFINEKIPQKNRDKIWLLADGSQIMWIKGYRHSMQYQVTMETKRILEVTFLEEDYERDN
ncbi:MAG: tRNA lysidine(34) synthetase TilS [Dorea sp.]|nr:tRNA lysidine(34) synthetase TilS [Dorea sp.]